MQPLYDYAMELDVRIEYDDLTHLQRYGDFHLASRTIRLQHGLLYRRERSTLAHELAHATFSDEPSMLEHTNRRQEARADEWAAHFLIDPHEYRIAEEKCGNNTEAIAIELHVTKRLVEAYERTLHRIGDAVYVKPAFGRYQAKYEVA